MSRHLHENKYKLGLSIASVVKLIDTSVFSSELASVLKLGSINVFWGLTTWLPGRHDYKNIGGFLYTFFSCAHFTLLLFRIIQSELCYHVKDFVGLDESKK